MWKKAAALALCCALCFGACAATAEPMRVVGSSTAYLGDSNYLYLLNSQGIVKRLNVPMADVLGADEEYVYCVSQSGEIYAVLLDATGCKVLSAEETPATGDGRYSLVAQRLSLPASAEGGEETLVSEKAELACASQDVLYYVERSSVNADRFMLRCYSLGSEQALTTVPGFSMVVVNQPIGMLATELAVTLVNADHSVSVVDIATGWKTEFAASSQQTIAAFWLKDRLYRFVPMAEGEGYQLEQIDDAPLSQRQPVSTPTAALTPVPTPLPTPTATMNWNTPTVWPTATPDVIYKWERSSRVRRMQQRLSELGYPVGNVDGAFGDNTLLAVHLFQNAIHVKEKNYVTRSVLNKLYASDAPIYDVYLPLSRGDEGISVYYMQSALRYLGYNPGNVDGKYGANTAAAASPAGSRRRH